MRIWKFALAITDSQAIAMPFGAQTLSVQEQDGDLCVWAIVNPAAPVVPVRFYVVGTGNPMPWPSWVTNPRHLGTVQTHGGSLVWHVFVAGLA
jgi:hypothetical protein